MPANPRSGIPSKFHAAKGALTQARMRYIDREAARTGMSGKLALWSHEDKFDFFCTLSMMRRMNGGKARALDSAVAPVPLLEARVSDHDRPYLEKIESAISELYDMELRHTLRAALERVKHEGAFDEAGTPADEDDRVESSEDTRWNSVRQAKSRSRGYDTADETARLQQFYDKSHRAGR